MIDKNCFMPLNYFKKTDYTGSMTGLRFRLGKAVVPYTEQEKEQLRSEGKEVKEEDGTTILRALIWEGPLCLEKSDPEKSYYRDFPFTADGIQEAVDWLNQEYLAGRDKWDNIPFWTPQMSKEWKEQ